MGRRRKLGLLASLYLSQGLPFGFFTQALPVLLRREGVSLEEVGLSSLLAAPWALKFLWGPWVDRHGRRRSWILPLQLLAAGLLLLLVPFPPGEQLLPLLVAVGLTNLVAATQDVASDGLAVDLLDPAERGLGNGVQVAGYRLGMILGGGVLLAALDLLGWRSACLLLAGALLAATLPVARYREPPRPRSAAPPSRPWDPAHLRRLGPWLVLLGVYKTGDALGGGMLRPFLVDAGLSLTNIAWLLGLVGFGAGLVGALLGGALVQPLGRRRALVLFGLLQALGMVCYLFAALFTPGLPGLSALVAVEHCVGGMATAALFTVMMDRCRPGAAASDYTVQACVVVVATGLGAGFSGFSAAALGYAGHFGLSALLCLPGVLWVAWSRALDPASPPPGGVDGPQGS